MIKTKLNLRLLFTTMSGLALVVGALFFTVPVFAHHGLDSGECAIKYGTSGSQFGLCTEHARVDTDIAACQSRGGTPDAIERCIARVRPASDGYPVPPQERDPNNECYNKTNEACFDDLTLVDNEEFEKNVSENAITRWLTTIINFLAAGVGLVVTSMIVVSGLEYIFARGDPNKVAHAKGKIANAVIALVVFIFMYAILQWLIPGGVF